MDFLEKDLSNIIYKTPNDQLRDRGLSISGHKLREFQIGNYGRADIITFQRPEYDGEYRIGGGELTIYELKNKEINVDSFIQVVRYAKGMRRMVNAYGAQYLKYPRIRMVLVGRSIDLRNDFVYLADIVEGLEVYTYEYNFDGITFDSRDGFHLSNEGFKIKKRRVESGYVLPN